MFGEPDNAFRVDIPQDQNVAQPLITNSAEDSIFFRSFWLNSPRPILNDTILWQLQPASVCVQSNCKHHREEKEWLIEEMKSASQKIKRVLK